MMSSTGESTAQSSTAQQQAARVQQHTEAVRRHMWLPKRQRVNLAASALMTEVEPATFEEAMISPEAEFWKQAADEEMTSLQVNHTWEMEELPQEVKPLPAKWVFKRKRDSSGNIER